MKKNFLGRFLGLTALMFTLLFTTASAEVYEGTGYGYNQDGIVLGVEIKDNKIVDIQIKKEQESDFAKPAVKEIIKKAIATQSYEVDGVSGASLTSEGTKEANGEEYIIKAKAVIVATGGFGANAKMVEKYNPKLKGFGSTNNPAIVGDGIVMIEKIGGALVDMDQIQTHPTVLHKKTNMITEAVRGEGAILVNKDGKRFIDELETRDVVSKAILDQKGKSAFLIFDEEIRTKLKAADGYVKKGYAVEGTLEEIAAKIGTDAKTLEATLNKYNEAVKNKADNEFKKKTLPKELTGTKYYAIEVSPAVHHTMGGVRINTNAEVLGKNGRPIKGLYAAGEVTGGIHGANRIGGNAVADITVFGKIAGENAATYSKSVK